jgi:UDP-glucose 4-epimerase
MKTVLITGSNGYIGSHLVKHLRGQYNILGLDTDTDRNSLENFLQIDIKNIKHVNIHVDCVVHLAALVKVNESVSNPISYYLTNTLGSINVLQKIKFNNFIFASTGSAEYCNNPYGISKRAAEDCVINYCELYKKNYTVFRFYNVIGSSGFAPTNPDGLFYNLINATRTGKFTIFGDDYNTIDGTAERDYVHVDEICEAIKTAIENPANGLENLGHGQGFSVKQITTIFQNVNKTKFAVNYGPRRVGDLERSILSNPSVYLPNLYNIEELLTVPQTLL